MSCSEPEGRTFSQQGCFAAGVSGQWIGFRGSSSCQRRVQSKGRRAAHERKACVRYKSPIVTSVRAYVVDLEAGWRADASVYPCVGDMLFVALLFKFDFSTPSVPLR